GSGCGAEVVADLETVAIGKARLLLEGKRIAILGFGTLTMQALPVAEQLNATLVDMRFVKPIDKDLLKNLAQSHDAFVTIEDAAIMGGAGSAVAELFHQEGIRHPILQLGYPDQFIDHGDQAVLHSQLGLDSSGFMAAIKKRFPNLLSHAA